MQKTEEAFKLKEALVNHVVKTTQHVIMLDAISKTPSGGGSGCLLGYRGRCFFVTVQHVADKVGKETCLVVGNTSAQGEELYNVGAMNFVDVYQILRIDSENPELKTLKPLDIAYIEIKDSIEIFQPELLFDKYKVTVGNKQIHFSETAELPNKDECYSFSGRIRGKLHGNDLVQQPKVVLCFQYDCKVGYFERFILHETIADPLDFQGTSGAPIISETGEVVAFVANGAIGTKHLYGFSSAELKKFLDIYIEQNPA